MSVLIATRNRCTGLCDVLQNLQLARTRAARPIEIIVIDNGSSDATATLLDEWAATQADNRHLYVAQPGRSRALNAGLAVARGQLLVFTDDDVGIPAQWLATLLDFFRTHDEYAAAMGRVHLPPEVTDPEVIRMARLYRGTLPLFDAGDASKEVDYMYGCSMVVRRSALDAIGNFDERLGVGASGLCEDIDLSQRLRAKGLRIGYIPDAVIYHTVDATRLTFAAYRDFQIRDARSRYLMEPNRHWLESLGRYIEATLARWTWAVRGNHEKQLWARGRAIRQRELLRLRRLGAES